MLGHEAKSSRIWPSEYLACADEHLTLNQRVHGSSPCAPTIEINDLANNLDDQNEPESFPDNVSDNNQRISLSGSMEPRSWRYVR